MLKVKLGSLPLLVMMSSCCATRTQHTNPAPDVIPGEQKHKPIIAAPGDDVILPCRLDSEKDLQFQTIEWSRQDLEHDLFSFVLYKGSRIITEVMNKQFIPRVSLNPDGLKRGDVTLKIRKVTLQDEGTYRCFIPGLNHRETVHLVVDPNGVTAPTMETSQFDINISTPDPGGEQTNIWISRSRPALWISLELFTLLIISAVCGYIFQRRGQKCQKPFVV